MKVAPPSSHHADDLYDQGFQRVAGIDEVGRGCWAGPLVVGAVILPRGLEIAGLTDSKLLSPLRRVHLARTIKASALGIGLGWVTPAEIDQVGLTEALRLGSLAALANLPWPADAIILDGSYDYLSTSIPTRTLVKGDQLSYAVAAASVVAKVARDSYMSALELKFPGYGFAQHKGYGTAVHAKALGHLGVSPMHRHSFAPVAAASHQAQ